MVSLLKIEVTSTSLLGISTTAGGLVIPYLTAISSYSLNTTYLRVTEFSRSASVNRVSNWLETADYPLKAEQKSTI